MQVLLCLISTYQKLVNVSSVNISSLKIQFMHYYAYFILNTLYNEKSI